MKHTSTHETPASATLPHARTPPSHPPFPQEAATHESGRTAFEFASGKATPLPQEVALIATLLVAASSASPELLEQLLTMVDGEHARTGMGIDWVPPRTSDWNKGGPWRTLHHKLLHLRENGPVDFRAVAEVMDGEFGLELVGSDIDSYVAMVRRGSLVGPMRSNKSKPVCRFTAALQGVAAHLRQRGATLRRMYTRAREATPAQTSTCFASRVELCEHVDELQEQVRLQSHYKRKALGEIQNVKRLKKDVRKEETAKATTKMRERIASYRAKMTAEAAKDAAVGVLDSKLKRMSSWRNSANKRARTAETAANRCQL